MSSLATKEQDNDELAIALSDSNSQIKRYKRLQWSVFLAATLGYGVYYVCRLSLSVVKKPIVDAGVLSESELGIIGSTLFFAYAFGKFFNGFAADRCNVRYFMSLGLLISAVVNLCLGVTTYFVFFAILWGINGWFQSIGAASSVVGITRWYGKKNRGTFYGLWSSSHNIGEALTFILTAAVVSWLGWQYGFYAAGSVGIMGALLIVVCMRNSPKEAGFESLADVEPVKKKAVILTGKQLDVLKNPAIWILALASAFMYISRYAINSWGPFYLEANKGYSTLEANAVVAIAPVCGIVGTIASGFVSDRVFNSRRNVPALIFGILNVAGIGLLLFGPEGYVWLDWIAMVLFGTAIGALICLVGGLMAVDIASDKAPGAALGVIGVASYIGAGVQDIISGHLIEAGKTAVEQTEVYDFKIVSIFWIASAAMSVILALLVWRTDPNSTAIDQE